MEEARHPIPADHPLRATLNREVHARPPEPLPERASLTYLAIFGERSIAPLKALCERFGHPAPSGDASHFSADFGPFRIKWEKHTEFVRYKFIVSRKLRDPLFAEPAIAAVPSDWLISLPGSIIAANHVEIAPLPARPQDDEALSRRYFDGNTLIGATVAGGLGRAFTDFQTRADGFGRILVLDGGMSPRQRGRTAQRLLEIDTYRMMALLTLPEAQALMSELNPHETELAGITSAMRAADETQEPALLNRLTLLHSEIARRQTGTQFRFSAARAYSGLVSLRISELRLGRIEGLQPFDEFIERRLGPAMRTCEAAEGRLEELSEQVARATQLLSTRVDITREAQNQSLLESMNRRAALQLRLQETVEGLSIAAITYYIVGLVGYAADGLKSLGILHVEKPVVTLAAIPVVIALVALGLRRVRKRLER